MKNQNKSIIFYTLISLVSLSLLFYLANIKNVKVKDTISIEIDEGVVDEPNINEEMFEEILNKVKDIKTSKVRSIDQTDHTLGASSSKIELIIYEDFECPFCVDYAKTLKILVEEFSDKIKIAVRHFPLSIHSNAIKAALVSECAAEQGKFWEMYDKLYDDNVKLKMNMEEYITDAKELELDVEVFTACVEEEKYLNKISEQTEEAKTFGVLGTPASFLNGKNLPGAYPMEDYIDQDNKKQKGLRTLIIDELARVES